MNEIDNYSCHKARVDLAINLMKQGKSDKEILKRFSYYEDFDRKTTKEHIAFLRRMRRGY